MARIFVSMASKAPGYGEEWERIFGPRPKQKPGERGRLKKRNVPDPVHIKDFRGKGLNHGK